MRESIYLTFNRRGVSGYRKGKPPLKSGEYAVRLIIDVPDAYFERAIPTAEVRVPEGSIIEPEVSVEIDPLAATPAPQGATQEEDVASRAEP